MASDHKLRPIDRCNLWRPTTETSLDDEIASTLLITLYIGRGHFWHLKVEKFDTKISESHSLPAPAIVCKRFRLPAATFAGKGSFFFTSDDVVILHSFFCSLFSIFQRGDLIPICEGEPWEGRWLLPSTTFLHFTLSSMQVLLILTCLPWISSSRMQNASSFQEFHGLFLGSLLLHHFFFNNLVIDYSAKEEVIFVL